MHTEKEQSTRRWLRYLVCFSLIATLFACFVLSATDSQLARFSSGEEKKVIRVGYPLQQGLTEIDENGNYTGYTYEYLQELSHYTGWSYEFVTVEGGLNESLNALTEMLKKGEIDLLGGMVYSESLAEEYAYPGYSYGNSYTSLCVSQENSSVNEWNLAVQRPLKVAVLENAKYRNAMLDEYAKTTGIEIEKVACTSARKQLETVESGKAHAFLSASLSVPEGTRVIANFSPQPFYFMTTKGNTDIINTLNVALLQMNEVDPLFESKLFEKYFRSGDPILTFSQEEKKYMKAAKPLRVAVSSDYAPFEYKNEKTGQMEGFSIKLLDYIKSQTPLDFELVVVDSPQQAKEKLREKEVDLILTVPRNYDYVTQEGVLLSSAYIQLPVLLVSSQKGDASKIPIYIEQGFKELASWDDLSISERLNAVQTGERDYFLENSFSMEHYMGLKDYNNLKITALTSSQNMNYCIVASAEVDTKLMTILNRVIYTISEETTQSLLLEEINHPVEFSLRALIKANAVAFYSTLLVIFAFIVIVIVVYLRKYSKLARLRALENERYVQLAQVSQECIFEYDYKKQTIMFTQKGIFVNRKPRDIKEYREECQQYLMKEKDSLQSFYGWLIAKQEGSGEILLSFDGSESVWCNIISKIVSDETGTPVSMIGRIIDIQEAIKEKEKLEHLAQEDSLTRLLNSATSRQMVGNILKENGPQQKFAFLVMDIDNFKKLNDTYGHYVGDEFLVEVAVLLKQVFTTKNTIIGRVGGDEFIVFLSEAVSKESIEENCSVFKKELMSAKVQQAMGLTVSVGGIIGAGKLDYETVFKKADGVMYEVKQQGRNNYIILDETKE